MFVKNLIKQPADDLIVGQGFVCSGAAPLLQSFQSRSSVQAFVGPENGPVRLSKSTLGQAKLSQVIPADIQQKKEK